MHVFSVYLILIAFKGQQAVKAGRAGSLANTPRLPLWLLGAWRTRGFRRPGWWWWGLVGVSSLRVTRVVKGVVVQVGDEEAWCCRERLKKRVAVWVLCLLQQWEGELTYCCRGRMLKGRCIKKMRKRGSRGRGGSEGGGLRMGE